MSSILQITLKRLDERSEIFASERAHLSHRIEAMIQREGVYKCRDYIAYYKDNKSKMILDMSNDVKHNDGECSYSPSASFSSSPLSSSPPPLKRRRTNSSSSSNNSINGNDGHSSSNDSSSKTCNNRKVFIADDKSRQEMCEWSCRIVDHFGGDRVLVAIAQNYLDRFLCKYMCDIVGYKLAAITCLCLAVKVHNKKPISMKSLSKLSSGEITTQEITEMESVILKALDWKLCPPTASNFCIHFHALLPIGSALFSDEKMRLTILQRVCFFAELSLFDYSLTLLNASEVAFAAVLNGLEDVDMGEMAGTETETETKGITGTIETRDDEKEMKKQLARSSLLLLSDKCKRQFIEDIEFYSGLDSNSQRITMARNKLWVLYWRSKQHHQHQQQQQLLRQQE